MLNSFKGVHAKSTAKKKKIFWNGRVTLGYSFTNGSVFDGMSCNSRSREEFEFYSYHDQSSAASVWYDCTSFRLPVQPCKRRCSVRKIHGQLNCAPCAPVLLFSLLPSPAVR